MAGGRCSSNSSLRSYKLVLVDSCLWVSRSSHSVFPYLQRDGLWPGRRDGFDNSKSLLDLKWTFSAPCVRKSRWSHTFEIKKFSFFLWGDVWERVRGKSAVGRVVGLGFVAFGWLDFIRLILAPICFALYDVSEQVLEWAKSLPPSSHWFGTWWILGRATLFCFGIAWYGAGRIVAVCGIMARYLIDLCGCVSYRVI